MKLARRIALAMALVVVVVLTLQAFAAVQRERNLLEGDMEHDHLVAARAVSAAMIHEWRTEGVGGARRVLALATRNEDALQLRLGFLDARPDEPGASLPDFTPRERASLTAGEPVTRRVVSTDARGAHLASYVPVAAPDGRAAVLVVDESLAEADRYVTHTIWRAAGVGVGLAALCSALTLAIGAVLVGRPVRELVRHARAVGEGDLAARSRPERPDELGELGVEMNAMSARLASARDALAAETDRRVQALEQLRHADRLTTVGKLAAGLAHELGTPLNVVHGHAKLVRDDEVVPDDAREGARVIVEQTERMTRLVRQLLDFARRRAPRRESVALGEVCAQAAAMLQAMATKRGVTVVAADAAPDIVASADPAGLQQILTNLIVNAIHASPGGGRVTLSCSHRVSTTPAPGIDPAPGGYVDIVVTDDGPGVPDELLERIFEPFFTTKSVGEGTGLGLSVSHGIARDHGGWIEVGRAEGRGARFTVVIPLEASAP